jgi:hypothetical protein
MKTLEDYHNALPYRKTNDDKFSNIIVKMMEAYGLKDKLMEFRIKKFWKEEMGPQINNYTKTIYSNNRKVFIQLSSSSLRQELSYGKDKIMKMMNESFSEDYVEEIILL